VKGYVRGLDVKTGSVYGFSTPSEAGRIWDTNMGTIRPITPATPARGASQMSVDEQMEMVYLPVELTHWGCYYGGHRPAMGLFGDAW